MKLLWGSSNVLLALCSFIIALHGKETSLERELSFGVDSLSLLVQS